MFENSMWIKTKKDYGEACPKFKKDFNLEKSVEKATLSITATGVYEAYINEKRVGDFIMAPGWTSYEARHQYQTYDVTDMLGKKNSVCVTVGKGWYRGALTDKRRTNIWGGVSAVIIQLDITYSDGTSESVLSDTSWKCGMSKILFSEIYDGEIYDAAASDECNEDVMQYRYTKLPLIEQEGEFVCEREEIKAKDMFYTPKGELVIDFGQNLTGYVKFDITAKKGEVLSYSHAEILDKDGNFYTDNLRSAKQQIKYICTDGKQTYKPHHTFMGYRYIRLDEAPKNIKKEDFVSVAVYSNMERTGFFSCSDDKINKLYSNIIWGQRSNFLDVPTDCPQRDERLGWTGDAQVFVKTASYNYDVQKFFKKWLRDLKNDQFANGSVPQVIPNILGSWSGSAGWGDASVICPWQIYLTYGDKTVLQEQLDSMIKWVEYMRTRGDNEYLWLDKNFGDWLGLDAKEGDLKGATREDFISTAYFAYSTSILAKALKVLGKDNSEYVSLHKKTVNAFRERFTDYKTQTECALALYFDLAPNKEKTANQLAKMIKENGNKLKTGFVGTPYLLDALSHNGNSDVAYDLLFQEENPSWLFSVNMGATTIWEHWDGVKKDGTFWSDSMNSYNHYAYGSVASFFYETICGINIDESKPGFEHVIIRPVIDNRLTFANASIKTVSGVVSSKWVREGEDITFEFEVPKSASFVFEDETAELAKGKHIIKRKLA